MVSCFRNSTENIESAAAVLFASQTVEPIPYLLSQGMSNWRKRSGFTLAELLLALFIMSVGAAFFLWQGGPSLTSSKQVLARQQAKAIQSALESWLGDQPTVKDARTTFNADLAQTSPASQVAFFSGQLAQYLDADLAADITASSTAALIRSTGMSTCNASCTITWDTNYYGNHPKVNLTIP